MAHDHDHDDGDDDRFECGKCGGTFDSEASLKEHAREEHGKDV